MDGWSSDPRLASYTVGKVIGRGSYGEVFLVKYCKDKKQYVMKNIKLSSSTAKERLAAEQEASLLSQLQHPNIVSYRESFQDALGVLHIVMGYCEGGDLHSRLKARKGELLPEPQVVEWFVQITLALQYLHERNILHRDLKTQNIFLSKNDIIKVGDLGIARVLDGSCDLANTIIGTPYYMSPELFANKPYNHKSDIWALGCCVHEMATLKHTFTAQNINALMYKIIQGKVPPLPSQFSPDLSNLVLLMMSQDARRRPSAQQILRLEYVRRQIKLFLERASHRKQKKGSSNKGTTKTNGESSSNGVSGVCEGGGRGMECLAPVVSGRRRSSSDAIGREVTHTPLPKPSPQPPPPSGKQRSTSLTTLPQNSPENKIKQQKPPHKAKKPPRPLPPDPSLCGRQDNRALDCKPPPSPAAVSSARERRRRHKQQEAAAAGSGGGGRGRVVLRSRSSSDLQRRSSGESEGRPSSGGSSRRNSIDKGHDSPDGSGNSSPCIEKKPQNGSGNSSPCTERKDMPLFGGVVETDGINLDAGSSEESNNEVDEFYTLLDSTLHLPEPPPHEVGCRDVPQPRVAFETEGDTPLPSGRLADRIAILRRECDRGLGAILIKKAFALLDQIDPENAEEALMQLLGEENFESYAAKLQQLKLCEESLYGL